ncbi:NAD-dependent epimerase/dehydratase family protein [Streptomyces sp. NPDC088116]|uniref:NAD-dependent epimerase/dehydratase family protein n=1 Tax=Streptomyces sp. NPDC088116 TaxID=3365825 RepID=UPI003805ED24
MSRTTGSPIRSDDPRGPLITVLGGSGFIGSAVVGELARQPVRLRTVSRGPGRTPARAVAAVEVRQADLARPGAVHDAVQGADAVIHLAAHIGGAQSWRAADERAERVNVGVMRDLVDSLRGRAGTGLPPAVIFASTLQAGTGEDAGQGAYARQKTTAENLLREATSEAVVRGVVLRLATVFGHSPLAGTTGPGSTGRGVIAAMTRRAIDGDPITMWHDGSVRRDFLHVRDAGLAFVAALRHVEELRGEPWVVGTGRLEPLGDVFSAVAALVAEHTGRPPVPVVSVEPPDHAEAGDFHTPDSDPAAFRAVTGWQPGVPLGDGLNAVVTAMVAEREEGKMGRTDETGGGGLA